MAKKSGKKRRSSSAANHVVPILEDKWLNDDAQLDLLLPSRDESNSPSTMSQDAEDGPEFLPFGLNKPRPAMNQEEFDALYKYTPPHHEHSEFVRRAAKFVRGYVEPCTSLSKFGQTLLGFVPIVRWLPAYQWRQDFTADLTGGITLAIVHIPQGIAYSVLAGLPPIVGLYISFFPPLLYMLFGTARHNSVGSFAVVALMTRLAIEDVNKPFTSGGNSTSPTDGGDPVGVPYDPVVVASTLAFLIGLLHFTMGVFRLEIVTTYFSDAVVGGFSTGAACHVFVTQLKDFFGVRNTVQYDGAFNLFKKLLNIVEQVPKTTNVATLVISLSSLAFLVAGKNFVNPLLKRRLKLPMPLPFELILIIATTAIALLVHVHSNYQVAIVGELPTGMPGVKLPKFSLIPQLIPHAISICVVVAAVHISLAKMFGKRLHYTIDAGQELYALGFTSMLSSIFPVFPISCSLGRTVVNVDAGSKTQLASVFSSAVLLAVILYFGQLLRTLPMLIWLVSFTATVVWDVTEGLACAIIFALLTTVFRTQFPRWHYLSNLKGTNDFRDAERYHNIVDMNGICVFRFDAPLLFTNVERFKQNIHKAALRWKTARPQVLGPQDLAIQLPGDEVEKTVKHINDLVTREPKVFPVPFSKTTSGLMYRHFVIDCSGFTFVDTMGVNALKEIFNELRSHMILVYFAAAKAPVRDLFLKCGFYKFVPKSNFYPTIRDAVAIAKKRRASSTLHLLEEMSLPFDPLDEVMSVHAVT
ncbi:STAS domain-containing protein [Aphelenchoides fujianensis]|nr:STAS domain-containing protein [Aphelenchoides fujianensis]